MFMVMPDSWISTQVFIKRFTKYASISLHAQRFGLPQSMAAPDAETDISSGVSESDKDIVTRNFKLTCLLPSSNFPRVLACHVHAAINCVRSRCGNCLTAINCVSLRILRVLRFGDVMMMNSCHLHAAINCVRSRCGNCLTAINCVSLRILRVLRFGDVMMMNS